jgi:hypothetical protein
MPRRCQLFFAVICLLLLVCEFQAQTLQIIDAEGHATTLTATQLANLPHVTVDARDHETPVRFEGIPLATVLSTAGIQFGDTMRGRRMTEVLLVEAEDAYKVVFALAELDPAFATREIILADKRDGKPLDKREGPFRVVASGDKRPARWARQITTLRVAAVQ